MAAKQSEIEQLTVTAPVYLTLLPEQQGGSDLWTVLTGTAVLLTPNSTLTTLHYQLNWVLTRPFCEKSWSSD